MEKAVLSLEQFVQYRVKERKMFNENEVSKIMKILINALAMLEKQKIAHRDIKP
jgi:serine/threonine protein kinase